MPNYLRARAGSTFFFTLVSFERRPILCDESIRRALRTAIFNLRLTHPFMIDAWTLMPDHLHCIWTLPEGDTNYSIRWSRIKQSVSRFTSQLALDPQVRRLSARRNRESTIWQRRFWEHRIRDERDLERHLDYIHYNPVKHGYVQSVVDWPYSTFHRYVKAGWYPYDWTGGADPEWGDLE